VYTGALPRRSLRPTARHPRAAIRRNLARPMERSCKCHPA